MVLLAANRDSSELVLSYHLRQDLFEQILAKLPKRPAEKIPVCRTGYSSDFQKELQKDVLNYFKETGLESRGGLEMAIRVSFWVLLGIVLNIVVLWRGVFLLAPVLGWWLATIGLAVQHDANHGALFARPWLNEIFGLGDDLIGGSSLIWRHHHVVGHHVFTNDAVQDPDAFAGVPFLRLHPSNPQKWFHKYQHIYFGILTALMYYSYPFTDTAIFLSRKFGDIDFHPLSLQDKLEFWVGKFINIFLYGVIPFYFYGWSYLLPYTVLMGVGGAVLAITFVISHNTVEIDQGYLPQQGKGDWAEQQIRQSSNWGSENWFANFFTGGLNQQIEHHLFPCVSHRHYPALSLIVRKKCSERGIPYVTYPSLFSNCSSLFLHLKNLGNAPMKLD